MGGGLYEQGYNNNRWYQSRFYPHLSLNQCIDWPKKKTNITEHIYVCEWNFKHKLRSFCFSIAGLCERKRLSLKSLALHIKSQSPEVLRTNRFGRMIVWPAFSLFLGRETGLFFTDRDWSHRLGSCWWSQKE